MELYIIRHGQSANNARDEAAHKLGASHHDPSLTALGQQQAAALAAYFTDGRHHERRIDYRAGLDQPEPETNASNPFGITHLYCSAMYRALQTAQALGQAIGVAPEIWLDIHEHGGLYLEEDGKYVGYPGRTRSEIVAEFPTFIMPEGLSESGWWRTELGHESMSSSLGRVIAVAWELLRRAEKMPDARIALVSHGTFIDALIKSLLNQVPSRHYFQLHNNTGITRIDFAERERLIVRYVNRTEHLSPELMT